MCCEPNGMKAVALTTNSVADRAGKETQGVRDFSFPSKMICCVFSVPTESRA